MKKYKLIKEYPGSPKLGIEIIKSTIYGASSTKVVHTYMIKGDETFQLNNPKDYPEFWQEVVKKDYEILALARFCSIKPTITDVSDYGDEYIEAMLKCDNARIHSIKRLSDGEIFTIGDLVGTPGSIYPLKEFKIIDSENTVAAHCYKDKIGGSGHYNYRLKNLKKAKQPLFTTEDGVDIFNKDTKVYELFTSSYLLSELKYDFTNHYRNYTPKALIFSTKEAAEEYILMNKPCLSINDILSLSNSQYLNSGFKSQLEKLVQQKLNK